MVADGAGARTAIGDVGMTDCEGVAAGVGSGSRAPAEIGVIGGMAPGVGGVRGTPAGVASGLIGIGAVGAFAGIGAGVVSEPRGLAGVGIPRRVAPGSVGLAGTPGGTFAACTGFCCGAKLI